MNKRRAVLVQGVGLRSGKMWDGDYMATCGVVRTWIVVTPLTSATHGRDLEGRAFVVVVCRRRLHGRRAEVDRHFLLGV